MFVLINWSIVMINNPRFQEHCDYQHGCDISERIALNTELDYMTQEEIDEMNNLYELQEAYEGRFREIKEAWSLIENTHAIMGLAWSRDEGSIDVVNIIRQDFSNQIVLIGYITNYDYNSGIETCEYGIMYLRDIQFVDDELDSFIDNFIENNPIVEDDLPF